MILLLDTAIVGFNVMNWDDPPQNLPATVSKFAIQIQDNQNGWVKQDGLADEELMQYTRYQRNCIYIYIYVHIYIFIFMIHSP